MPSWEDTAYDITQPTANTTNPVAPKSSAPMTVQASGTLAAPANTATKPTAAITSVGTPSRCPIVTPRVAPITNSGVTSPPWKPDLSVTEVKRSLTANASDATPTPP